MLTLGQTLRYYKRSDVQAALVEHAKGKEIGIRYQESFGPRPDVLRHPNDILEVVRRGATSFHASEELWKNPLNLTTSMSRRELDDLRSGWDLVIDLDCKLVEYSRIAADLTVKFLKHQGIKCLSIKFSGNKGFHIGIPYEAFPAKVKNEKTSSLFPEGPKKIAFFLQEMIKEPLNKGILAYEHGNFKKIVEKTGKAPAEIVSYRIGEAHERIPELNVEPFLNIDTLLISSRHMYRMPYSMHEKSGLVSVPIDADHILEFNPEDARPEKVVVSKLKFLDREMAGAGSGSGSGEASKLWLQAIDFTARKEVEGFRRDSDKQHSQETHGEFEEIPKTEANEANFPPCIKKILLGLEDGRKRGLFILINFFSSIGWSYEQIEKEVTEWNKRNKEPLRENYVHSQLHYQKHRKKKVLPPNCDNQGYYKDMGVHLPDETCRGIRNPINYVMRKIRKPRSFAGDSGRRPKNARNKDKIEERNKDKAGQGA